ncbi:MAG: hypothetical protein M3Q75_04250 [Gemmatimonadota bacterium]|nr:hypothetical protein [Gemmatimonadota bacterium]
MFETILLIIAVVLFLIDAFASHVMPNVNKTALGLACVAFVMLIGTGVLGRLGG